MPSHRWPRASRRPLAAAVSAAVVLPLCALLPTARAEDEPARETVVGELVRVWAEHLDPAEATEHAEDGPLSWVRPESGEAVRVTAEDVEDIPVGATVEVTVGEEVTDAASREQGIEPSREVLAATVLEAPAIAPPVAPAGTPTNRVTVVGVLPVGVTPPATTPIDQLTTLVNGPVADFWREQTDGAVEVRATASPEWVTVSRGCDDWFGMWEDAADAVGWHGAPGDGEHLLLYVGQAAAAFAGCTDGLGTVGGGLGHGGRLYTKGLHPSIVAHELGHNFGLGHASALSCNRHTEEAADNTCRIEAYNDRYDVMGFSGGNLGTLNAPHAALLGLLPAGQQARVLARDDGTRTFTLLPAGGRAGTRAIELVDAEGAAYWLEYRAATGRDAWLPGSGLEAGVQVRRENGGGHTSLLLDATPVEGQWGRPAESALAVGRPVTVADGQFVVTVSAADAASATVVVTTGEIGPARLPIGSLDGVSISGPTLSARGWAIDPNTPTRPAQVHVYVDGRGAAVLAAGSRPDVARVFPDAGAGHGFDYSTTVAPGRHMVCAYAIDTGNRGSTSLGCSVATYTPQLPTGSLDRALLTGRVLTVDGWALDADTPAVSGQIHLYVDGRGVALTADRSRPDIGRAHPGAGDAHGFSYSTDVTPGTHRICAYAIDTSAGGSTSLGCRVVTYVPALPTGALDGASVADGHLTLGGWTVDTDTPTVSGQVHVYVGTRGFSMTANMSRADIGRAFPGAGNAHGFGFGTPVAPGAHRVCAYAIDTEGRGSVLLGCRTVTG